jgi:hypothetical protein
MTDISVLRMEKIEVIFPHRFYYLDDLGLRYERFSDIPKYIVVEVKKR